MRFLVSTLLLLLAVLCVAVQLSSAAAAPAAAAGAASSASALPAFVSQLTHMTAQACAPVVSRVLPFVPAPLRTLASPFLHGAVSVVLVGRSARRPPASVNGEAGDALLEHSTAKFVYAAGAIAAELMVLKLVHREPYRNLRRNPMNRLLCTPLGFACLVLLAAVPNDVVDASLLCVLWWRLSDAVYTPAIVCGQLLRVYAAALLPRLPPLSAAYTALLAYWAAGQREEKDGEVAAGVVAEAVAEVALAAVVAAAFLFNASARRGSGTAKAAARQAPESDGDDYYED